MNARLILATVIVSSVGTEAMADVLLIPDSGNDKIWAFSPIDGSVVDPDFVPADGNMQQAICAIGSGNGTILVSDENADSVFEYDLNGGFLGTLAGPNEGLDALFGMTVRAGQIYVVSRSQGIVYRLDLDGSNLTPWAIDLNTPRDLVFRSEDALVTESSADDILSVALDGTLNGIWHDSDGVGGIDFPQQIQPLGADQFIVAGFTAPFGLYVYNSDGTEAAAYTNLITSPRGVYPLANGKYLYAGGTRVMIYDPVTQTEEDSINEPGTSFRFIELLEITGDLNDDGRVDGADLGLLLGQWGPCRPTAPCDGDLNGDGMVDGADLGVLLAAWSD